MADKWSQLPHDLLSLLTKRLDLDDLIRFSCVCPTWKSFSSPLLPPKHTPWLIVPYGAYTSKQDSTVCDQTLGLFNLSNRHTYKFSTPQLADRRIIGSCKGGWLITVHENGEIQVFHPFSKTLINLPPVTKLPGVTGSFIDRNNDLQYKIPMGDQRATFVSTSVREFYISKAVMSTSDPTTSTVMAIQGMSGSLAFCRPGKDKAWRSLEGDNEDFDDIAYHGNKFYAVKNFAHVLVVDGLDGSSPFLKLLINPPYGFTNGKNYLVESLGELLLTAKLRYAPIEYHSLIERDPDYPAPYQTVYFRIAKLDMNGPKWVDVSDIGMDRALFIGYNHSFSISTLEFTGCNGDSIYFTDDYKGDAEESYGGQDMGVFSLKNHDIQRIYPRSSKAIKPPPVWFTTHSG